MHVACMNHWDTVIKQQIWKVKESGLLAATQRIFWGVVGEPDTLFFDPIFMSKVEIKFTDSNLALYEFPTLRILEDLCRRRDAIVWYIHTKGVSVYPPNRGKEAWREYMEYFVVDNWKKCHEAIEAGADAVGTIWQPKSHHFAGNFWWASSDHIKRLPAISTLDHADRLAAEQWIGSPIPKHSRKMLDLCPTSSNVMIPREMYLPPAKFNSKPWEG